MDAWFVRRQLRDLPEAIEHLHCDYDLFLQSRFSLASSWPDETRLLPGHAFAVSCHSALLYQFNTGQRACSDPSRLMHSSLACV